MWFYRGWEGLLWHVVKKFYKKIKIFFSSKGSQPRRNDIILKFCSFFENFYLKYFYINFKKTQLHRGWRSLLFKGQKKIHFSIFWTNLHTIFFSNLYRLYPIYNFITTFYRESLLYLYTWVICNTKNSTLYFNLISNINIKIYFWHDILQFTICLHLWNIIKFYKNYSNDNFDQHDAKPSFTIFSFIYL